MEEKSYENVSNKKILKTKINNFISQILKNKKKFNALKKEFKSILNYLEAILKEEDHSSFHENVEKILSLQKENKGKNTFLNDLIYLEKFFSSKDSGKNLSQIIIPIENLKRYFSEDHVSKIYTQNYIDRILNTCVHSTEYLVTHLNEIEPKGPLTTFFKNTNTDGEQIIIILLTNIEMILSYFFNNLSEISALKICNLIQACLSIHLRNEKDNLLLKNQAVKFSLMRLMTFLLQLVKEISEKITKDTHPENIRKLKQLYLTTTYQSILEIEDFPNFPSVSRPRIALFYTAYSEKILKAFFTHEISNYLYDLKNKNFYDLEAVILIFQKIWICSSSLLSKRDPISLHKHNSRENFSIPKYINVVLKTIDVSPTQTLSNFETTLTRITRQKRILSTEEHENMLKEIHSLNQEEETAIKKFNILELHKIYLNLLEKYVLLEDEMAVIFYGSQVYHSLFMGSSETIDNLKFLDLMISYLHFQHQEFPDSLPKFLQNLFEIIKDSVEEKTKISIKNETNDAIDSLEQEYKVKDKNNKISSSPIISRQSKIKILQSIYYLYSIETFLKKNRDKQKRKDSFKNYSSFYSLIEENENYLKDILLRKLYIKIKIEMICLADEETLSKKWIDFIDSKGHLLFSSSFFDLLIPMLSLDKTNSYTILLKLLDQASLIKNPLLQKLTKQMIMGIYLFHFFIAKKQTEEEKMQFRTIAENFYLEADSLVIPSNRELFNPVIAHIEKNGTLNSDYIKSELINGFHIIQILYIQNDSLKIKNFKEMISSFCEEIAAFSVENHLYKFIIDLLEKTNKENKFIPVESYLGEIRKTICSRLNKTLPYAKLGNWEISGTQFSLDLIKFSLETQDNLQKAYQEKNINVRLSNGCLLIELDDDTTLTANKIKFIKKHIKKLKIEIPKKSKKSVHKKKEKNNKKISIQKSISVRNIHRLFAIEENKKLLEKSKEKQLPISTKKPRLTKTLSLRNFLKEKDAKHLSMNSMIDIIKFSINDHKILLSDLLDHKSQYTTDIFSHGIRIHLFRIFQLTKNLSEASEHISITTNDEKSNRLRNLIAYRIFDDINFLVEKSNTVLLSETFGTLDVDLLYGSMMENSKLIPDDSKNFLNLLKQKQKNLCELLKNFSSRKKLKTKFLENKEFLWLCLGTFISLLFIYKKYKECNSSKIPFSGDLIDLLSQCNFFIRNPIAHETSIKFMEEKNFNLLSTTLWELTKKFGKEFVVEEIKETQNSILFQG